ncbi:hypothetical protein L1987_63277 [Smallanthus sonchifolius]|uniref:Uncharacterized protein n=1 Tax=Smallanthus sonchifolius TaxID=185202 RepID=A0ACB9CD12_9ASTR|nr:hypothetical protein L1987_63277 [Smallanthus sonchifolius]
MMEFFQVNVIAQIQLSHVRYRWVWLMDEMTGFLVKGLHERIDVFLLLCGSRNTYWFRSLPRKVNIYGWRVLGNRIPTKCNLDQRGMDVPDVLCPLCNDAFETVSHIVGECTKVERIWMLVAV